MTERHLPQQLPLVELTERIREPAVVEVWSLASFDPANLEHQQRVLAMYPPSGTRTIRTRWHCAADVRCQSHRKRNYDSSDGDAPRISPTRARPKTHRGDRCEARSRERALRNRRAQRPVLFRLRFRLRIGRRSTERNRAFSLHVDPK